MRISTVHYTTTTRSISRLDDTTCVDEDRRPRFRSYTLPPSPSYSRSASSSSSDFEFSIASSATAAIDLHQRSSVSEADVITPADDLFYKGKILPLQLTPRLSMVKSLFFDSSSSVSSASANSRYSTGSSSSGASESHRPSSFVDLAEDDDDFIITEPTSAGQIGQSEGQSQCRTGQQLQRKSKPFSLGMKLSSVFKTEPRKTTSESMTTSAAASGPSNQKSAARDVMRKYMNKVRPFYEKMARRRKVLKRESAARDDTGEVGTFSDELFSGNKYRNNRQGVAISCPASIRSSPCHSGLLSIAPMAKMDSSSEELQSAIQGAIAHCKNSMLHN